MVREAENLKEKDEAAVKKNEKAAGISAIEAE
jgi:hypothetical protein